jgi:hypothetical protein
MTTADPYGNKPKEEVHMQHARRGRGLVMLAGLAWGVGMQAQQVVAAGATPMGSVSGHVIAQDTQRAARFATVLLQSVASASSSDGLTDGDGSRASFGATFIGRNGMVSAQTDVDGNFLAGNVAPGDYYVTATAPGYIPERALLQAAVNAAASPAALLAQMPVVHVAAGSSSSVVVTIERGATIAGLVQWEDGSPASGLSVRAVLSTAAVAGSGAQTLPGGLQGIQELQGIPVGGGAQGTVMTDDRGGFRISGLAPGDYTVQATIPPPAQSGGAGNTPRIQSPVRVYSPGVFRKAETKAISVGAGDERSDVRMMIDLHSLRTVSGEVTSSDPSKNVASGRAMLVDPNNPDLQRASSIGQDGSFAFYYVPAGTYTVQVSGASSQSGGGRGRGNQGSGVSFQPGSQTITVADRDVTDAAITLTPVQSSQ